MLAVDDDAVPDKSAVNGPCVVAGVVVDALVGDGRTMVSVLDDESGSRQWLRSAGKAIVHNAHITGFGWNVP